MEKYLDINEKGYSVRCKLYTQKKDSLTSHLVLCTHGFGGNKENHSAKKFAEKITAKYKDYGVLCFDWPCHGADARKKLSLDECLDYLDLAVSYAKDELGANTLYYYGTSFGGYLGLVYLKKRGNPFFRIALRAPGIPMYQLMKNKLSEEDQKKVAKGKEVLVGFERKMKLDKSFLEDLQENDVQKQEYFDVADAMLILQGTEDEMVPFPVVKQFAEDNVIEFYPVEGGNHIFSNPKHLDFAIHTILTFFAPQV